MRLTAGFLIATVLAGAPLMASAVGGVVGGVIVQEQGGAYRVTARFQVPQSAAAVLAVLTDYEQIPRYMPDVKTSTVRSRGAGRVMVEQEAEARTLMFSKRIHLLLDIHESADGLWFVDTGGTSFTEYEGSWRLAVAGGETEVIYELRARPAFDVPRFVLARAMRKDATKMIEQLQVEIAARQATTPGGTR